jgi:hypothetical protein
LASTLSDALDDAPDALDPASLERFAGIAIVALEAPGLPTEAGFAIIDGLAARGDGHAASVLAALSVLASKPHRDRAATCVRALESAGVVSAGANQVGLLTIDSAMRVQDDGAELIAVLLARPESTDLQPVLCGIEHQESGGALLTCRLGPPEPVGDARKVLSGAGDPSTPEPIDGEEVRRRVVTALQRTVELDAPLDSESAIALPVLSLVLTGDPAGLPRPPVGAGLELEDDAQLIVDAAEDEAGFHEVIEMLRDELEQHARANHPPGGPMWQHGDFIASAMLQWKGDYDDGHLGRWTRADVASFLLDYFPRKVSVQEETIAVVPDCILGFL